MSRWQDQPRDRHESVTIRTIWLTLALSILIHVAALFVLIPHMRTLSDDLEQGEANAPVQVRLAPPPAIAIAPPEPSRDTRHRSRRQPAAQGRDAPPKQAMVVPNTGPSSPCRHRRRRHHHPSRRARGASGVRRSSLPSGSRGESGVHRRRRKGRYNRNIAANLPAVGCRRPRPKERRWHIRIKRLAYDDAVFDSTDGTGCRPPTQSRSAKGNNADMRIAVVRG